MKGAFFSKYFDRKVLPAAQGRDKTSTNKAHFALTFLLKLLTVEFISHSGAEIQPGDKKGTKIIQISDSGPT